VRKLKRGYFLLSSQPAKADNPKIPCKIPCSQGIAWTRVRSALRRQAVPMTGKPTQLAAETIAVDIERALEAAGSIDASWGDELKADLSSNADRMAKLRVLDAEAAIGIICQIVSDRYYPKMGTCSESPYSFDNNFGTVWNRAVVNSQKLLIQPSR
jgi:hypothetical protein